VEYGVRRLCLCWWVWQESDSSHHEDVFTLIYLRKIFCKSYNFNAIFKDDVQIKMIMTVLRDLAPFSLVELSPLLGRRFLSLIMEAVSTFETSVYICQTTFTISKKNSHFYAVRLVDPKSQIAEINPITVKVKKVNSH
jgi:hypothetical protein